ncbi:MAG: NAD(P)/FAD-dependent oxidoreductase [Candidatus Heimdallarchaeota archaeon]|nr:NAD(P)/FAD-dependent oxidoreductase [Candidatus Heimdallarchaeota archaeon]
MQDLSVLMPKYDFDLISIGSGSAGRRVSSALKKAGWNTAIVEKNVDGHFGGTCICTGCIPTKAIIESVSRNDNFRSAMEFKDRIVERIHAGTLRHVTERLNIEVIKGAAVFVNNHTIEVKGRQYTSDVIIIATGSKPMIPPIKGLADVAYSTSLSMLNLEKVPNRILIIGGGRIGLEFGQVYHKLGAEIIIFEGLPHLLPGEDEDMADLISKYLINQGIKIFKGKFVDEVREENKGKGTSEFTVILNEGPHAGEYSGDLLLVATGRVPNTSKLKLENTQVTLNQSAVAVNEYMQTSADNIFAIGDVVGMPMFTNWAGFQSLKLLENLRMSRTNDGSWKPLILPNFPRICFTTPELASTGLTETEAREKYGDHVVVFHYKNKWLGKSMILNDWDGVLKGVGLKGSNQIIGAHLWGERTGSLIQMIVFAIENNLGWKELADMVYGHPVLMEGIYSLAINMIRLVWK